MAAGCGIALDTSGRTDSRLGDKLEETFEDVDVSGFEKVIYCKSRVMNNLITGLDDK